MTFRHGINLASFSYYTTENQFVDAMLLATFNPNTIKYDPVTGAVTQPGSIQVIVPVIDGTHEYTVKTSAPIKSISFGNTSTPASYTSTAPDGKYKFTYTHDPANTNVIDVLVRITTKNPTDVIGKIQIYRTEHEALLEKNPYAWCPDFLASVKGFSPLRFMDWFKTNESPLVDTRPVPSGHMYDPSMGCPVELAADLCNQVNSDMWMNIPHLATDRLVQEMISVACRVLKPELTLYVEYSNEVWNASFTQYQYSAKQASIHYGSSYKQYSSEDNWYGYRSGQIAQIAHKVSPRAKLILATQMGSNTHKWERVLSGYHESGATNNMLGAISEAPYLSCKSPLATQIQWALSNNYDAMHSELVDSLNTHKPWFATIKAYADTLGVPLFCYEYNISVDAWRTSDLNQKAALVAFQQAYCHSKRAADLIKQHITGFAVAGGGAACFFNHVGKGGQYGEWGARPSTIATYPMYDFLREPLANWIPGYVPPVPPAPVISPTPGKTGVLTPTANTGKITGTFKL